jgi:hypothetical protein
MIRAPPSSGPVSLTWDTRGTPNGMQTFTVSVVDPAGGMGNATRTLNIQNSCPPGPFAGCLPAPRAPRSRGQCRWAPTTFTLTLDSTQVFTAEGSGAGTRTVNVQNAVPPASP